MRFVQIQSTTRRRLPQSRGMGMPYVDGLIPVRVKEMQRLVIRWDDDIVHKGRKFTISKTVSAASNHEEPTVMGKRGGAACVASVSLQVMCWNMHR